MRFRQIKQFLDARAEPDAQPFTTAEGDQRVGQLVGLALGVVGVPRVQVGEDALAAELAEHDHQHKGAHQHRHAEQEHAAVHAAQEQDGEHKGCPSRNVVARNQPLI